MFFQITSIKEVPIRYKFIFFAFIVLVVVFFTGWLGISGMRSLNEEVGSIKKNQFQPSSEIAKANILLIEWNRSILNAILADDASQRDKYEKRAREKAQNMLTTIAILKTTYTPTPMGVTILRKLEQLLSNGLQTAEEVFETARLQGDDRAREVMRQNLRPMVDELDLYMANFVRLQQRQLDTVIKRTDETYRQRQIAMVAAIFFCVVISCILMLLYGRWFSDRIKRVLDKSFTVLARSTGEKKDHESASGDEMIYLEKILGDILERMSRHIEELEATKRQLRHSHEIMDQKVENATRRLKSLTAELSLTEERERRMLASHVHDQVSAPITLAKIHMDEALSMADKEKLRFKIADALQLLQMAIQESRSLAHELSPPVLVQLGLEKAIEWYIEKTKSLGGIVVSLDFRDPLEGLNQDLKGFLFNAVRELLANVVQHSGADRALLVVSKLGDRVSLSLRDNGAGFDSRLLKYDGEFHPEGFGLLNLTMRVESFGGSLSIDSSPGTGTRVELTTPLFGGGGFRRDSI